jgi:hypothetical protein
MTAIALNGAPRVQSLTASSAGVSLNGWPGIKYSNDHRMAQLTVPGTHKSVLLRKEVLPVFLNLLARINKEVLPLNAGPLDSWEYRAARTGAGLSDHASGTAIDFRYDVLKADHQRHLTPAQRQKMEHILNAYKTPDGHRLFGWGGEWTPGKFCDEMHIEVGQAWQVGRAITPADFTRFAQSHHLRPNGTQAVSVVPAPHPPAAPSNRVHLHLLRPGLTNADVKTLQAALKRHGYNPGPLNGHFDATTQAAVKALQRHLGFFGFDADGVPGKKSLATLGLTAAA